VKRNQLVACILFWLHSEHPILLLTNNHAHATKINIDSHTIEAVTLQLVAHFVCFLWLVGLVHRLSPTLN